MGELLLRNGVVIDGTGAPGRPGDVRIRDGRVAEIGESLAVEGCQVIDVDGAVIAPGFIDNHTHFDASVFWDPRLDPMSEHGVTTILIGNCGLGLAPLHAEDRGEWADLFAYIEDIPLHLFETMLPWNWVTFDDYVREMSSRSFGTNIVTMFSHSLLRMWVMREEAWTRAATPDERAQMAEVLSKALDAGALGLSTSLLDQDRSGRPIPSRLADDEEFDALFEVVGRHGAAAQMLAAGGGSWTIRANDYRRLGQFSKKHGVPLLLNGFFDPASDPEFITSLLGVIDEMNADGAHLHAMMSPRSYDLRMNFNETLLLMYFPYLNKVVQSDKETKRKLLTDPAWREAARAEWDSDPSPLAIPARNPERIGIANVGHRPELTKLVGHSLDEIIKERGAHPIDVLADLLLETDCELEVVIKAGNVRPEVLGAMARQPAVVIGASDAGAHLQMFSAAGDGTLFLTRHVRDRGDLPLEQAINILTGRQADILSLGDRGVLKPGAVADIIVFKLDELNWGNEFQVNDVPGGGARLTRPAGGYRYTIVGGKIAQAGGKAVETLPGRFVTAAPAVLESQAG